MLAAVLVVTLDCLSPAVRGDLHKDDVHSLMKQLRAVITRPDYIAAGVAERSGEAVSALLGGAFESAVQLEASKLLTSIGRMGTKTVEALIRVGVISSLVGALKRAVELPDEELAPAIITPLHQMVLVAHDKGLQWASELLEADGLPPLVQLLDHQHEGAKRAATDVIRKLQIAPCLAPRPKCVDVAYTLFEHGALKKLSAMVLVPDVRMRHHAIAIVENILMPILDDLRERPGLQAAVIETMIDSEVLPNVLTASMRDMEVAVSRSNVGQFSDAAGHILTYNRVCNLLIREGTDTQQQIYAADHTCVEQACGFLTAEMQSPLWDWDYIDTLLVDSLAGALSSLSGSLRRRAKAFILTKRDGRCKQSIEQLVEHPTDAIQMRAKRAMELLEANVESMADDTDTESLLDESEGRSQPTGLVAASAKMLALELQSDDKLQLVGTLLGMVKGTAQSEELVVLQYVDQLGEAVLRVARETGDDDVQRAAGDVLSGFAGSGPRVVDALIRLGAVPSLVEALTRSTELSGRGAVGALKPVNALRPLQILLGEDGAESAKSQLVEVGGLPLLAKLLDYGDLSVKAAAIRILAMTPGGHRVLSRRALGIAIILAALAMLPRLWRFLYLHILRLRQYRREQQAERHQRELLAGEEADKKDKGRGGKGRHTNVPRRPVAQPSSGAADTGGGSNDGGGRASAPTASSSSSSGRQTPNVLREVSTTVAEMESDDRQWTAVTRNRSNRTKRGRTTQAISSHQTATSSPAKRVSEGHPSGAVSSATSTANPTPRDTLPMSVSIAQRRRAAGRGLGLPTIASPPPSMGAAPSAPWLPSAEVISNPKAHRRSPRPLPLPPPPPPPPSPPELSSGAALSKELSSPVSSACAQAGASHNRGPPPLVNHGRFASCGGGDGRSVTPVTLPDRSPACLPSSSFDEGNDRPRQPQRPSPPATTAGAASNSAAVVDCLICFGEHGPATVMYIPCRHMHICTTCYARRKTTWQQNLPRVKAENARREQESRERIKQDKEPLELLHGATCVSSARRMWLLLGRWMTWRGGPRAHSCRSQPDRCM
ncbi:unnamed protein product [Vitrella brassicaformis CCMP3155]|uniref:RING-type domain-containing protein n=1 Tax=Vitrella brassicaformis (strain CCMP3155) TaxID=1169540 RepID=A0A0G4G244_VITBC|nr:unnamed protein product [Vitrella brassicaformis CCMP3155]|eukprot:CEM22147.1 unnamed protein product [Vitrella brassicaformis CCMP3155]